MRGRLNIISILAVAVLTSACQKNDEAAEEPARPVLSTVVALTRPQSLSLPGTVEPKVETELGFRILGRIIARPVNVGDLVHQGDVVAAIDPISLELAVRSSQSDLDNSQAQLNNATSTEQRQRALLENRSGTEAALEEAEQAKLTAIASVSKARANLKKVQEQLGYAQLKAEFDGVVTATSAEVGQVVSAGLTVVTIARPDQRDAVVDVPQLAAQALKPGDRFDVSLQLDPEVRATGVVREIAPEAEAATRTRRTKITLIDPPAAFRLGSVITASSADLGDPTIRLPSSAALRSTDGDAVWVVDTGAKKVSLRRVKILGDLVEGGMVTIADGVTEGERVVIAGVHKLKDGQAIRIDQEVKQ